MTGRYDRPELAEPDTLTLFDLPAVTTDDRPGQPPVTIQQAFERFHAANPWVAVELRTMALDLVRAGHGRIGMKMLFEVLRWRYMRATTDTSSTFKLNNNYHSRYARMLMESEPELHEVFETRTCVTA